VNTVRGRLSIIFVALVAVAPSALAADVVCVKYEFICRPRERCSTKAATAVKLESGQCPRGYTAAFSALGIDDVEAVVSERVSSMGIGEQGAMGPRGEAGPRGFVGPEGPEGAADRFDGTSWAARRRRSGRSTGATRSSGADGANGSEWSLGARESGLGT
jgi:hypothetical protein